MAIVARIGRDPAVLPWGVCYTHVGFWVYSWIQRADGRTGQGFRVYNFYQLPDTLTRSHLGQDSPADFMAGAFRFDADIIVPKPELQRKLLAVIAGPTYAALHNPRYSVLSNPDNTQFQNCTEHIMDVLMASLCDTRSVPQIKANIAAHFWPQELRIGGLRRLLEPASRRRTSWPRRSTGLLRTRLTGSSTCQAVPVCPG